MEKDTMAAILDDADEVFRFEQDSRPQERAHRYLTEKQVNRGFNDTAMLCVVNDLVKRAHTLGVTEGYEVGVEEGYETGCEETEDDVAPAGGNDLARALLYKCGGELIMAAQQMGGE